MLRLFQVETEAVFRDLWKSLCVVTWVSSVVSCTCAVTGALQELFLFGRILQLQLRRVQFELCF